MACMGPLHIYKISNLKNSKIYIGKTSLNPPEKRWKSHLDTTRRGPDDHQRYQYLHRAISKHGKRNFKFEVIATYHDEKEWTQAEIDFIARFGSNDRKRGYNLTIGGDGALGYRFSPAQRRRMSERRKGRYVGSANPFFRKRHSRETRRRIGELAAKRFSDPRANPFFGRRHTAEALARMSERCHRKQPYLTEHQVNEVRRLYASGRYTQEQLASELQINPHLLKKALRARGIYATIGAPLPRTETNFLRRTTRPRMHGLEPSQVADLRRRYRAGERSWADLARPLGVKPSLVAHAVGGHGCYADMECGEPPIRHEKSSSLPAAKVDQVRQLYATGEFTYAELGKKFGVSGNVIRHAVLGRQGYAKVGTPLPKAEGHWTKNSRRRIDDD